LAEDLIKSGKSFDLLPREAFSQPITAFRFHSFLGVETEYDTFSTDFSQTQFENTFKADNIPTMIAFSLKDEYVPCLYDNNVEKGRPLILGMLEVWKTIIENNIKKNGKPQDTKNLVVVKTYEGPHELGDRKDEFVADVVSFVNSVWV